MKSHGFDLNKGSTIKNFAVESGQALPVTQNIEEGQLFWLKGNGANAGMYIFSGTWQKLMTSTQAPSFFGPTGKLEQMKIFTATVVSASTGSFNVDMTAAGFTQMPTVTATVRNATANAFDKPFATITSVTDKLVTGVVIKGTQTIVLAGVAVLYAGVQTVSIIAIGQ